MCFISNLILVAEMHGYIFVGFFFFATKEQRNCFSSFTEASCWKLLFFMRSINSY